MFAAAVADKKDAKRFRHGVCGACVLECCMLKMFATGNFWVSGCPAVG
jgi:hypothetical protein